MIVGLTGAYCAGKGEAAAYLAKKGFEYFSCSDEIRSILKEKGVEPGRDAMIKEGNELRKKFGAGYLASRIARKLKKSGVVDSIRNVEEINVLRETGKFILVYIDAPPELRFERAKKRGRAGEGETFEEFMEKENRERSTEINEQQLDLCMEQADYKIMNDSSLEDLHRQIDGVINRELKA